MQIFQYYPSIMLKTLPFRAEWMAQSSHNNERMRTTLLLGEYDKYSKNSCFLHTRLKSKVFLQKKDKLSSR